MPSRGVLKWPSHVNSSAPPPPPPPTLVGSIQAGGGVNPGTQPSTDATKSFNAVITSGSPDSYAWAFVGSPPTGLVLDSPTNQASVTARLLAGTAAPGLASFTIQCTITQTGLGSITPQLGSSLTMNPPPPPPPAPGSESYNALRENIPVWINPRMFNSVLPQHFTDLTITAAPAFGTATVFAARDGTKDGRIRWVPPTDFTGSVAIGYTLTRTNGSPISSTATINIAAISNPAAPSGSTFQTVTTMTVTNRGPTTTVDRGFSSTIFLPQNCVKAAWINKLWARIGGVERELQIDKVNTYDNGSLRECRIFVMVPALATNASTTIEIGMKNAAHGSNVAFGSPNYAVAVYFIDSDIWQIRLPSDFAAQQVTPTIDGVTATAVALSAGNFWGGAPNTLVEHLVQNYSGATYKIAILYGASGGEGVIQLQKLTPGACTISFAQTGAGTINITKVYSGSNTEVTHSADWSDASPLLSEQLRIGPLCNEIHRIVKPKNGGTPHPALTVAMSVRYLANGNVQYYAAIENSSAFTQRRNIAVRFTVSVGAAVVFSSRRLAMPPGSRKPWFGGDRDTFYGRQRKDEWLHGLLIPTPDNRNATPSDPGTPTFSVGTCTFTQGSFIVNGSGTNFPASFASNVEQYIRVTGSGTEGWYRVKTVVSATQLYLFEPYQDATTTATAERLGPLLQGFSPRWGLPGFAASWAGGYIYGSTGGRSPLSRCLIPEPIIKWVHGGQTTETQVDYIAFAENWCSWMDYNLRDDTTANAAKKWRPIDLRDHLGFTIPNAPGYESPADRLAGVQLGAASIGREGWNWPVFGSMSIAHDGLYELWAYLWTGEQFYADLVQMRAIRSRCLMMVDSHSNAAPYGRASTFNGGLANGVAINRSSSTAQRSRGWMSRDAIQWRIIVADTDPQRDLAVAMCEHAFAAFADDLERSTPNGVPGDEGYFPSSPPTNVMGIEGMAGFDTARPEGPLYDGVLQSSNPPATRVRYNAPAWMTSYICMGIGWGGGMGIANADLPVARVSRSIFGSAGDVFNRNVAVDGIGWATAIAGEHWWGFAGGDAYPMNIGGTIHPNRERFCRHEYELYQERLKGVADTLGPDGGAVPSADDLFTTRYDYGAGLTNSPYYDSSQDGFASIQKSGLAICYQLNLPDINRGRWLYDKMHSTFQHPLETNPEYQMLFKPENYSPGA